MRQEASEVAGTTGDAGRPSPLAEVIRRVADRLPAQGPIGVFIHHNPLHAFEDLTFERAVVGAGELFGCKPFLSEDRYRQKLRRGRIRIQDVGAVLDRELGEAAHTRVAGITTRGELRRAVLVHGIPPGPFPQVDWLVHETDVLNDVRADVPAEARERLLGAAWLEVRPRARAERARTVVRALWDACVGIAQAYESVAAPHALPRRHRDVIQTRTGIDTDELVHPVLIRTSAAFVDQGIANWPAPDRQLGFFEWFSRLYGAPRTWTSARWSRDLGRVVTEARGLGAHACLEDSLEALGVAEADQEAYLVATALALRGWAGMIRQLEVRPDRVPVWAPPSSLTEWLAVRLLLERVAGAFAIRVAGLPQTLAELWHGRARAMPDRQVHPLERAWLLFHGAQLLGLSPELLGSLSASDAAELLREIEGFDDRERRRILHLAFERRYRHQILDALSREAPERSRSPKLQAVFCLDEREESFRRHLEEVLPECETFGAAGFFGVAMYYRGALDAHPRPSCPIVIRPQHAVNEQALFVGPVRRSPKQPRVGSTVLAGSGSAGSHMVVRGSIFATLVGVFAAIPLTLRVLFPRFAGWLRRNHTRIVESPRRTRLAVDRNDEVPVLGEHTGFTKAEQAQIVAELLGAIGVTEFAPLVFVLGHGSSSLNNPHESAYDCGACGGGRGGPNARAFAQMANDPSVRAELQRKGRPIPERTWFIGAEHDTCNDAIRYFDLERVPSALLHELAEARRFFDAARARNAHERCRRFDNAPLWMRGWLALAHVEARSEDLAQPRPEYGHATNAVCVVGRRARTRDLYLDRRAFLVSYDGVADPDGGVLERLLRAVVPVVSGINLEYYFGRVDPRGYGSGTKLPHNVTGLIGVMDGHASDLRTGLTHQMVELHEPMRLLLVIEAPRERVEGVLASDAQLRRLVENRWIQLAALDPDGSAILVHDGVGFEAYTPESVALAEAQGSRDWYSGKRGHLAPALLRSSPRAAQDGAS